MIRTSTMRYSLPRLALLCVAAAPSVAFAQSSRTFADITGSVGYSTNPFLSTDGDGSAFGRLSLFAAHSITGERSQTEFTGFVENSFYLNDYGSKQIFELTAQTRYKASETLQLFGDAGFSGDIGGQLSGRFNDLPTAPPVPEASGILLLPNQLNNDVVNLDRRQYNAFGRVGAAFTVSQRDSISVSAGLQRIFFGSDDQDLDYSIATANAAWQHQLTERTTLGARVGVQHANYAGPDNSATVISPQVTLGTRVAEGWDIDLGAGVSFVSRRSPLGNDRSVGPAIDASACRTTESARYCARGSHSIQTVSGQDARRTTSLGADYFRRINPRDTLQARIGLIRYGGDSSLTDSDSASFYMGGLSYSRKFSDRLSGGADFAARKYVQSMTGSIPGDFTGSAFLRYRFGDVN